MDAPKAPWRMNSPARFVGITSAGRCQQADCRPDRHQAIKASHDTVPWHQVWHGVLLYGTGAACSWHCFEQSTTAPYAQAALLVVAQCALVLLGWYASGRGGQPRLTATRAALHVLWTHLATAMRAANTPSHTSNPIIGF